MSLDSNSQVIEGIQVPGRYYPDAFRSALSYNPRPNDLFLATFPKCGSTWTGQILTLLFQNGEPMKSIMDMFFKFPFLDLTGSEFLENLPRPYTIKTHLPFQRTPWSDEAKYIYLTRNPKDCCVSYFYHMKNVPWHRYKGTFDEFFEDFITGRTDYGDYFDHLLSWYAHKNDPNVLFITYEELKEDTDATILKMASFINDEKYAEPTRKDPEIINNIKKYSCLKEMRDFMSQGFASLAKMKPEDLLNSEFQVPYVIKDIFKEQMSNTKTAEDTHQFMEDFGQFFRKGVIGDWKNMFSEDQSRRLEEKFLERTKGTDIPELWEKYMQ